VATSKCCFCNFRLANTFFAMNRLHVVMLRLSNLLRCSSTPARDSLQNLWKTEVLAGVKALQFSLLSPCFSHEYDSKSMPSLKPAFFENRDDKVVTRTNIKRLHAMVGLPGPRREGLAASAVRRRRRQLSGLNLPWLRVRCLGCLLLVPQGTNDVVSAGGGVTTVVAAARFKIKRDGHALASTSALGSLTLWQLVTTTVAAAALVMWVFGECFENTVFTVFKSIFRQLGATGIKSDLIVS